MSVGPSQREVLHEALHDVARRQPPVTVPADLYRRGRRAHRRGIVLSAAAAAVTVGLVAVGGPALVDPAQPGAAGPAAGSSPGALPSHVYAVRPGLGPTGQRGWHEDLAVPSLAVGPLSIVFDADRFVLPGLVGVTADEGRYVGLDLPGLSTEWTRRFSGNAAALTADGDRLAYSWRDARRPRQSGVRVLDLVTGEVTDHRVPAEHGVLTGGLSWSPDETYLAYGRATVTDPPHGVEGARSFRVERLDVTTGQRVVVPVQPGEGAVSVTDGGAVAVPGTPVRLWPKGDGLVPAVSVAWSDDGEQVALGDGDGDAGVLNRRGAAMSGLEEAPDQGRLTRRVHVLGWVDDEEFAVRVDNVEKVLAVGAVTAETRTLLTMDPEVTAPSVATDLLGVPVRDDPAPPWARPWWDRALRSPALALVGVGLVTVVVVVTSVRRRRARGGRLS